MSDWNEDEVDAVALAINAKWNEIGNVPSALYQQEAEDLARAAILALRKRPAEMEGGWPGNSAFHTMIEEIVRYHMRDEDGDVLYNGCVSVGYVQPENAAQKIIEDIATQILALPTPAREIDRPVAWRVRDCADGWIIYTDETQAKFDADQRGARIEPLIIGGRHV